MRKIEYQGQFKKDYKVALKRGYDIERLKKVIMLLANEETLPAKYRNHALINSREYKGVRECHIQPDWLLIYKIEDSILKLIRMGSHVDLF